MQTAPRRQSACPACSADTKAACSDQQLEMRTCNRVSECSARGIQCNVQINSAAGSACLHVIWIDRARACVQTGIQAFRLVLPEVETLSSLGGRSRDAIVSWTPCILLSIRTCIIITCVYTCAGHVHRELLNGPVRLG